MNISPTFLVLAGMALVAQGYPPYFSTECYVPVGTRVMGLASAADDTTTFTFSPALVDGKYVAGTSYSVTATGSSKGAMIASSAGTWSSPPESSDVCTSQATTGFRTDTKPVATDNYAATWTAPSGGDVTFYSTKAPGYGLVSTTSLTVQSASAGAPTTKSPTPPPTTATPTPASLCDDSNTYGSVDSASVPGIAANGLKACWKKDGSNYNMVLEIKSGFWGALGLSDNQFMPNTDIYWISYDGSTVTAEIRYTDSKETPEVESDPTYMANLVTSSDGNIATINFDRPAAASGNRKSMETSSFVLLASGNAPEAYHVGLKLASSQAVTFASTGQSQATVTKFGTVQKVAHGAMMVFAWVFLAPTGMYDARFMKELLGAWWIKLHMWMMITATLLTLIGIIIVATDPAVEYSTLIDIDSDSPDSAKKSAMHAQMGIAIVVLAFFQVALGLLRKKISNETEETKTKEHPHGPRRWMFNYAHWLTGFALLIITLINVYSGFGLGPDGDWVKEPVKDFYYVAVGFGAGFFVIIELIKIPGRLNKESAWKSSIELVSRHAFALVAAATLASAITISTIVADSD